MNDMFREKVHLMKTFLANPRNNFWARMSLAAPFFLVYWLVDSIPMSKEVSNIVGSLMIGGLVLAIQYIRHLGGTKTFMFD